MAKKTNFGKAFQQSMLFRLNAHPDEIVNGVHRMELKDAFPAFWLILMNQTYFTAGINVDHRTLADAVAAVPGCVFGYDSHTSLNKWYDDNFYKLGVATFAQPVISDSNDDSTITLPSRTLVFSGNATFPMTNIGGGALCLTNTAAAATEVFAYYEFTTGAVTATSTGQTLALSNGTVVLSEA